MNVQFIGAPLIIFAWPQPKVLNLLLNVMVIQKKKKRLFVVSEFVVAVWDGLDECELSLPEILSWCLFTNDSFIS